MACTLSRVFPHPTIRRPGAAARLVRRARSLAGMTQRELAAAAGVPQATVARIETGTTQPRLETVLLLCNAAGHELELVPRAGEGVDRSLVRQGLRREPAERAAHLADDARSVTRLQRAARR